MKSILLILLGTIIFCACTSNDSKVRIQPFEQEKTLRGKSLFIDDVIAPDFIMLKNHSLFVVSTKNDSMLYQYSIPDLQPLYKGGIKGQGKDEFQTFPMFCRTASDDVYVWGYTPFTIKHFFVSEGQPLSYVGEHILPVYESFNQMHIIKDSILVYSAIPSEYAIKKIDLKRQKECGKIIIETEGHGETFYYKNRGIVAANDEYIIYAYLYKKQIDIYKIKDMQLYKRMVGWDVEPTIQIGGDNVNYYINVIAKDKFFYVLCEGEDKDYALEVFDYKGNSVVKYKFDIVPHLFDVDEQEEILYGCNYELEDCFFHYDISPL